MGNDALFVIGLQGSGDTIAFFLQDWDLSGGMGALTLAAKVAQAAAALEQYIALDRSDITYSAKTALQQMSKPTKLMQLRVVRVAR